MRWIKSRELVKINWKVVFWVQTQSQKQNETTRCGSSWTFWKLSRKKANAYIEFEDVLKSVIWKTANFKVAKYISDVRKERFVLEEWIINMENFIIDLFCMNTRLAWRTRFGQHQWSLQPKKLDSIAQWKLLYCWANHQGKWWRSKM